MEHGTDILLFEKKQRHTSTWNDLEILLGPVFTSKRTEHVWTLRALECSPWRLFGPFVVHLYSPAPLVPRSAGNAREHFPKINDVQLLS